MRSMCRNCTGFGKCGFVAYFPTTVHSCPDYKRGKINHKQDCYMEVETKRGRKPKGYVAPVMATRGRPSKKAPLSPQRVESRVRKILADFPWDFKAKDLKDAYEQKHKQPLVVTKELRCKVSKPGSCGWMQNICRVKRRAQKV